MTTLVIENKSYVVVPMENFQALQKKAALKTKPEKTLTLKEARAHSKKLIRKWDTNAFPIRRNTSSYFSNRRTN